MDDYLRRFFNFSTFIETLKKMERYRGQYYWRDYETLPRYDSVAEHTWRVAMLVLIFADKLSQKLDLEKAIKMALIHDLPEIIHGDDHPMGEDGTGKATYAYQTDLKQQRFLSEQKAAKKLFGKLPKDQADELFNLWLEYETRESFEAKVVKAFDRLEAMLQVLEYRKGKEMAPGHLKFTIEYPGKVADVDPVINKFWKLLSRELKKNYRSHIINSQTLEP